MKFCKLVLVWIFLAALIHPSFSDLLSKVCLDQDEIVHNLSNFVLALHHETLASRVYPQVLGSWTRRKFFCACFVHLSAACLRGDDMASESCERFVVPRSIWYQQKIHRSHEHLYQQIAANLKSLAWSLNFQICHPSIEVDLYRKGQYVLFKCLLGQNNNTIIYNKNI